MNTDSDLADMIETDPSNLTEPQIIRCLQLHLGYYGNITVFNDTLIIACIRECMQLTNYVDEVNEMIKHIQSCAGKLSHKICELFIRTWIVICPSFPMYADLISIMIHTNEYAQNPDHWGHNIEIKEYILRKDPKSVLSMRNPNAHDIMVAISADGSLYRCLMTKHKIILSQLSPCYLALKSSEKALRYFKDDAYFSVLCRFAVTQNTSALKYVPIEVMSDFLLYKACKKDPVSVAKYVPRYVPLKLIKPRLYEIMLNKCPTVTKHLPNHPFVTCGLLLAYKISIVRRSGSLRLLPRELIDMIIRYLKS